MPIDVVSRLRRMGAVGVAVLGLLAQLPSPSLAQTTSEPVDRFDETVRVDVVNLEVVVTDPEGDRVPGLSREDFVVTVDGVETPVRFFHEVGAVGEASATDAPPVNFLVFIDDHTTLKRNRDLTLEMLRSELPLLRPVDSMSVVAYDGRALEVLSEWSSDVAALDASFAGAMDRPTTGIKWVALARMTTFVANWIGNASRRGILAAASSMRTLDLRPGRKVLLLVAGSWDPLEVRIAHNTSPWCLSGPCFGNFVFSALTDTANQLGYSIYAVDVEGRDVHGSWWREQRIQSMLGVLADETGGRRLLNTQRRRALSIAAADSRGGYYSIGVEPERMRPHRRHRIEVEMLPEGLEARTRSSFVALTERRYRDLDTLSTLLSDADLEGPGFPVEIGVRTRRKGGEMAVPISVFAPTGRLQWVETDGRHRASFEVGLATLDRYGRSAVETHQVTLEGSRTARPGELEHLEFELVVPRRRQTLAVVVRDLQGERVLSSVVEIERPGEAAPEEDAPPVAAGPGGSPGALSSRAR